MTPPGDAGDFVETAVFDEDDFAPTQWPVDDLGDRLESDAS